MSRLYARTQTDKRRTDATACAHQALTSVITWGSASDSRALVRVGVDWRKGEKAPRVFVTLGDREAAYSVGGPASQQLLEWGGVENA